jgi:hypothetical protein
VTDMECVRAVLLCGMGDRLKLRAISVLVDAALERDRATNASALRLTLADEPNGPQIPPETP